MILGVTGTRDGLTMAQDMAVRAFLVGAKAFGIEEIHHGCCIGADARVHALCTIEGAIEIPVVIHPPINTRNLAELTGEVERKAPKEYMERNRNIVDNSDVLLVMPNSLHEKVRSGTWACYRYAVKSLRPIVIIWPTGNIEYSVV